MASTAEYAALDTKGGEAGYGELEFVPLVLQPAPSHSPDSSEERISSVGTDGKVEELRSMDGGRAKKRRDLALCIISTVVMIVIVATVCVLVTFSGPSQSVDSFSTASYRTAFHFQPPKNWMNDPNGLMYYMGYYHLFYQYNPAGPMWGNISWGHAVSKDLVHWHHINQTALTPGPHWYDINGVWSGSSTILPDGSPALLYTGYSNISQIYQIQTQNLAFPLNDSDPLLREWVKSPSNPIMAPGKQFEAIDFRDPTEGWVGADGQWRVLVGGRAVKHNAGTAHLYKSRNFVNWTYSHELHAVNETGMWECPDFFPVGMEGMEGLDVSANSEKLKHVLKMSSSTVSHDYYVVGNYDSVLDSFTPDDPDLDLGLGLRYDYGKFYASKTFFDKETSRRILFGWINESDSREDASSKGWSGIQSVPRQIWLDPDTANNLLQSPIEEINSLHQESVHKVNFTLPAGSVVAVEGIHGPQLDVQLEFSKPALDMNMMFNGTDTSSTEAQDVCSRNGTRPGGLLGPFGVLVLAEKDLEEQTAVFFRITLAWDGTWQALLCSDQSRSSLQKDVDKTTYGTYLQVLESDQFLTLRVLVDHSVVESFSQGGRTVITARVYPKEAVNDKAYFYLFNNGTEDVQVQSLNAWRMEAAPLDDLPA